MRKSQIQVPVRFTLISHTYEPTFNLHQRDHIRESHCTGGPPITQRNTTRTTSYVCALFNEMLEIRARIRITQALAPLRIIRGDPLEGPENARNLEFCTRVRELTKYVHK